MEHIGFLKASQPHANGVPVTNFRHIEVLIMINEALPQDVLHAANFFITRKSNVSTHIMKCAHFHAYFEIFYMLKGQKQYFIENRLYQLQRGDMVFFPPYKLHKNSFNQENEFEGILIYFTDRFLFEGEDVLQHTIDHLTHSSNFLFRFDRADQKNIKILLGRMLYEYKDKQPGRDLFLKTLLSQWLIGIYRKILLEGDIPTSHLSPLHQKGSDIAQYIEEHHRETLSLADISRHFSISTYYLCRLFKQTSGFSINKYLNFIRLRDAQMLLKDTNLSIIAVCETVGFGSISNFGRQFKEYFGVSPLQYRKYL